MSDQGIDQQAFLDLIERVNGLQTAVQARDATIQAMETAVQARDATNQRMETAVQARDATIQGMETAVQARNATIQARDACIRQMQYSLQQRDLMYSRLLQIHNQSQMNVNSPPTVHVQQSEWNAMCNELASLNGRVTYLETELGNIDRHLDERHLTQSLSAYSTHSKNRTKFSPSSRGQLRDSFEKMRNGNNHFVHGTRPRDPDRAYEAVKENVLSQCNPGKRQRIGNSLDEIYQTLDHRKKYKYQNDYDAVSKTPLRDNRSRPHHAYSPLERPATSG